MQRSVVSYGTVHCSPLYLSVLLALSLPHLRVIPSSLYLPLSLSSPSLILLNCLSPTPHTTSHPNTPHPTPLHYTPLHYTPSHPTPPHPTLQGRHTERECRRILLQLSLLLNPLRCTAHRHRKTPTETDRQTHIKSIENKRRDTTVWHSIW